jgi:hypothetical protein
MFGFNYAFQHFRIASFAFKQEEEHCEADEQ